MNLRSPSLLDTVAVLFVLLFQWNLIESWMDGPLERDSWMAMTVWLLPLLCFRMGWIGGQGREDSCQGLIITGIALTVLGIIGSVNTLKSFGLACALAGLVPWSPLSLAWVAVGITWMRPFGYLGSYYLDSYITTARLCVVIPVVMLTLWSIWRQREEKKHEIA